MAKYKGDHRYEPHHRPGKHADTHRTNQKDGDRLGNPDRGKDGDKHTTR